MVIVKYTPKYSPVEVFITRFFDNETNVLIFEQETQIPIPTLTVGDIIEIFEQEYIVKERKFAFNEDAFLTIYGLETV
ncbi:hypothetical protein A8L34_01335 [Bacillus sp. FJAT-27264]|uniref:hypothetical protein n=1 Tax=Paenibacillus sp. (strain DSM 101736 / FJAT-27264) TaxID=1850362 RepID=UPI000807C3F3|nr:hypothetical protein [Bacillus sp. FJAT-27264]OBZ18259.1 hypothetical protein A8L34_01335 [Bacillus sp. FJAT-27264]